MAFAQIHGQERALLLLRNALASGRLAQAYLFYGPKGVGKKLTARQFVKALYCPRILDDSCDTCPSCRKIDANNHPDVVWFTAHEATMTIEQIRTMQRRLGYKPYEGPRITAILDGCERLSLPAANALLKTLEEPPASVLLLLLSSNKEALPLTITSRCQGVPFRPLTREHMQAILEQQGVDHDTATSVAAFACGGIDILAHTDLTQVRDLHQRALDLLQAIATGKSVDCFLQVRSLATRREQCDTLLRWLALYCRDLVMVQLSADAMLYNEPLRATLSTLASRFPLSGLLHAFMLVEQSRRHLAMHANVQLVLEHLLLHLQQLLQPAPSRALA